MKKTALSFLSILFLVVPAYAGIPLREAMIQMPGVEAVHPIGPLFTYVQIESKKMWNTPDHPFYDALATYARENGFGAEAEVNAVDNMTGASAMRWVPVNLDENNDYINPATQSKAHFSYGILTEQTPVRFVGLVDMVDLWYGKLPNGKKVVRGLMFKHAVPQPVAFKDPGFPALADLRLPAEGEVHKKFVFGEKNSGFFDRPFDARQIYIGYATACARDGGVLRQVLRNPDASLSAYPFIEVTPRPMYESTNNTPEFFIACEGGKQPFMTRVLNEPGKEFPTAFFAQNRSLAEITGIKPIDPLELQTMTPQIQQTTDPMESLALEVAMTQTNTTKEAGSFFAGFFNGVVDGCFHVTVQKSNLPRVNREKDSMTTTMNYLVCNGKISQSEETLFAGRDTLPDDNALDPFIQNVARDAQKYGRAKSEALGFLMAANALRNQDGTDCAVEVRVFRGLQLVDRREMNGCM